MRIFLSAVCAGLGCVSLGLGDTNAAVRSSDVRSHDSELSPFGPSRFVTDTAWVLEGVRTNRPYVLRSEPWIGLLERYMEPARNRAPEWRSFWRGRYGRRSLHLLPRLSWTEAEFEVEGATSVDVNFDDAELTLSSTDPVSSQVYAAAEVFPTWSLEFGFGPEPELLAIAPRKVCPYWDAPRAVTVIRYDGAESERFTLTDCEGGISADAIDRLSVLARPPGAPRPELPLPLEPQTDENYEWLPQVKLVHPRLVWALQKVAQAFPNRSIYIMSGYRRNAHSSFHHKGRALDLFVTGVPNEEVFRVCRSLPEVGCGFYPNNKFVHLDVRSFGSPRVVWVDISEPGHPSQYVDGWPGLVQPGTSWLGG